MVRVNENTKSLEECLVNLTSETAPRQRFRFLQIRRMLNIFRLSRIVTNCATLLLM